MTEMVIAPLPLTLSHDPHSIHLGQLQGEHGVCEGLSGEHTSKAGLWTDASIANSGAPKRLISEKWAHKRWFAVP